MKDLKFEPKSLSNMSIGYNFRGMKIGFCTAPDKNNYIRLVQYMDTCRESVCYLLRDQINGKKKGKYLIDTKKTRLLFFRKARAELSKEKVKAFATRTDNQMLNGLKIANHLERKYGWARTKMQKVVFDDPVKYGDSNIRDQLNMYMVVGSSKWLKSSHLLSLYMLIFRLAYRGLKANFKTHEEFLQKLEDYSLTKKGDSYSVRAFHDKIDALLGNYNRLFGKRTLKSLYDSDSLVNGNGFNEGIHRLCTGYSADLDINERFAKICKENDIDYKVKRKRENRRTYPLVTRF